MSKFQDKLEKIVSNFNTSKYFKPISFFFLLFFVSGTLVFLFELGENNEFFNLMDGLWWAIITFSTTGYGDKVPITSAGRAVAVISIFIGIAGMSFLSGTFASVFVDRNTRARRGLMDFPKMKNHFIICGWKDHIQDILLDILSMSETISASNIIMISNIPTEKIEELKETKNLKGIRFVRGDYFSENTLRRANVTEAKKVIILADSYESSAPSEVDSKTVMTVLTIKAIAKDVYTCVELLDKKYENYLKQAMCDEIIYTRDFGRRMIAGSTALNGISHILYELLSQEREQSRLVTCEIPKEFLGKPYKEYRTAYEAFKDTILIGILENTGSPNAMKIEALREAQKTSDVSRLVNNLQRVKQLEVNRPMLVPPDDYIIQRYSRAILLERGESNGQGK